MEKVHYSSGKDDWETPQSFFENLNKEFNFTLDPCSTHANAKCKIHFTEEENGLLQSWGGITCFVTHHIAKQVDKMNGLKSATKKV